ncbi:MULTISPECIES: aldolase/citrate lyase family protein [unclassified Beijerinckia]|uniref:HpcH/HpaI aldolase family protein n=1 Tax=unclassified Beijerinckia TaxID=2638183 RepID=UPI000B88B1D2|nr:MULTISPECIES: aldolase/citrate lyase family protein [unclassified Beijerinckia]
MTSPAQSSFRRRLLNRECLVGSFIKTPTSHAIEIIGGAGFDFVVIDQEHAPFDRNATDVSLLAAWAAQVAGIVRVPVLSADAILSVLDCGAVGVLAPHVASVAQAEALVAACRYRRGARGFSGVTRAGGYGAGKMWSLVDGADASVATIAMIEDPAALDVIDAIVAVEGLDAVFIGRGDLTVAFGAPTRDAPVVRDAVDAIIAAAKKVGKPVCVMVDGAEEAADFAARGASAFIVSSDQGFLRKAAAQALAEMSALKVAS